MKLIVLGFLFVFHTLLSAQGMKINDVKFDVPGFVISKEKIKSGGAVTSFKIIPRDIDSYSEQEIAGIVVVTDASGNVMRVDPVLHKARIPDLSEMVSALEEGMSMQDICDKYQFDGLTEVQRMGFIRKFSVAVIIYEGDSVRMNLNAKTIESINKGLMQFGVKIENDAPVIEMRKWARQILRKVKFK